MTPDKRIIRFIRKHHVLTLATSANNKPWCANCFYAWLNDEQTFVFTSDVTTRHILESVGQPEVAGSVVLETKIIGKIQGIQFTGRLSEAKGEHYKKARKSYLKRFPFAILKETSLWLLKV